MFVTSLGAAGQLIESRRIGASRRMLSTPTSAGTVLLGETLGRFLIALFQGAVIVFASLVLFGVTWGDPLASAAVVVQFALVGTAAAMMLGSASNNAEQASSLGVFFGLGLAALGGCMVPLEFFPDTMRAIAHATPHAWAMDAFTEVIGGSGGVGDILLELAVLGGAAVVMMFVAVGTLRRSIVG